jgi:major membrane immunogen (membrane-anchored lipoprotein)
MKIDPQHAKRLLNSARPASVDAIVLAKNASDSAKNAEIKSLIDAAQKNMKTKEIILIAITTQ